MANDPNMITVAVGTICGTARPLMYIPSGWGGITILEAKAAMGGSALASLYLCTMTDGVNPVADITSLCGGSSAGWTKDLPQSFVFTTKYVADGSYIGVREATTGGAVGGTTAAYTNIMLSYLTGGHA